ncbi:MAG: Glyoxylate/hydroxypyruvate reductase B [Verrucomicrobiae bacterium]|nr:Glyoxylate/hydroxypyruvate reductase B [Verrucomicrobiae bacterium]
MSDRPVIVRLDVRSLPMSDAERQLLEAVPHRLVEVPESDPEIVRAAEVVMVVSSPLPAPLIAGMQHCRLISRIGTGVDKIAVASATQAGIIVNNLPGAFTDEVADHTLALLLAMARRVPQLDRAARQGHRPAGTAGIHRLAGQTVGIIGFGNIGRAVAKRCQAFGLRVIACDPFLPTADVPLVKLPALLAEADFICPLCPLTEETRGLLALPEFWQMKRTAILINTGRGELVNEDDLTVALREGLIQSAALDVFGIVNVFDGAGFSTAHPLFHLDNVLLTPHFGSASVESAHDCRRRAAQAAVDVLSGRWPEHPVNPEVHPRLPLQK